MKKILSTITMAIVLFVGANLMGQSKTSSIVVTSFVPEQDGLTRGAAKNMENKVSQMITEAGMGSIDNSRFAVIPRIFITDQRIQSSAPAMIVLKADITFYMGDVSTGKVFGSITKSVLGIGENETRAYVSLISNIKPRDQELMQFMEQGKKKIINYYNENADILINKAMQLASISNYDGALAILGEIPEECVEAFTKASGPMMSIYKSKIDYEGEILYREAYTLWNATLDYDGALDASGILAQISPYSSAAPKADALAESIGRRVREIDNREWDFKFQKLQNNLELQKAILQLATEVARAEANRPVYNYNVMWW